MWYGAAEFSRDVDIAILANNGNRDALAEALRDLQADCIAVPPFAATYLERGHAVHFRCQREDVRGLRVDVMERMRGTAPFDESWRRRTDVTIDDVAFHLMSLPDLVRAKKTQRDKDWPMIRRLVEVNYLSSRDAPSPEQLDFWLREARSPSILLELAERYPSETTAAASARPLLSQAIARDETALDAALFDEQRSEMSADRDYWRPLRAELEQLRRDRRTGE